MIELYVSGQTIRFYSPVIAADTQEFLTAHVSFTDESWEGYTRWAHFRQKDGRDDTVFDLMLDENDEITAAQGLNLTVGEWELYFTGRKGESRLTTVPVAFTVKDAGLVDAPLHPMPLSVSEQLDAKIERALGIAQGVRDDADSGVFNGKNANIKGFYPSLAALRAAVSDPEAGDMYAVGTEAPYEIFIWDAVSESWISNGHMQGPRGEKGAVFTPHLDTGGNLTWTNDGGLTNPAARNIMGPKGDDGAAGQPGASAYDKAVEAGYTGTEASFYAALTAMPYHAARHLPDGADPITVKTGNLENGAVTGVKLASGAVSARYTGTLTASGWNGSSAPYSQTLGVTGLLASDRPILDLTLSGSYQSDMAREEDWAKIYRAVPTANTLTVYAREKPTVDLPLQILCIRK